MPNLICSVCHREIKAMSQAQYIGNGKYRHTAHRLSTRAKAYDACYGCPNRSWDGTIQDYCCSVPVCTQKEDTNAR